MSKLLYKGSLIILGSVALMILLLSTGCKKIRAAAGDRSALEELFEENILNRDFIIHLAVDNGTDITSKYEGYNFVMTKTTSFYNGNLTATKAGVSYSGTWTTNEDFSKLDIGVTSPSLPPEFTFLVRSWRFTKKAFPVMELAPWGSTEPDVLHMKRL